MRLDIITQLADDSFINKYGVFIDEILQYPLENLNTVLKEMEDVLKGLKDSNSFTGICMEAKYDTEKVSILL